MRHSRWGSNKGQVSIMLAVMMLTFMIFFAFVVNTGMLVNAKINLQNAADLAAYAGAAVQARQLNTISYLNYEMRRQYKKFLFRYYVLGNMAQKSQPQSGGGNLPPGRVWSPNCLQDGSSCMGDAGFTDYKVPAVCIIFNQNDNYCQLGKLPQIEIPQSNPLDQINETLRTQLDAIEKIRQNNCESIANTNISTLMLWLYNTDPDLSNLSDSYSSGISNQQNATDLANMISKIKSISQGLGLIPREILLYWRIKNMADYLNEESQTITLGDATTMQSDSNPINERKIQAFFSAYYTLGNHTFNSDSITLEELLPKNKLFEFEKLKQTFDTYAIMFEGKDGQTPAKQQQAGDCIPKLNLVKVKDAPLGITKKPDILTYYALRLRATAKVLFSPFGDVKLTAYSAARPFGSRVGPSRTTFAHSVDLSSYSAHLSSNVGIGSGVAIDNQPSGILPNLPVTEDLDSLTAGTGWDTNTAIGTFYKVMIGSGGSDTVGSDQLNRAFQAATVPNPIEGNRYNIMGDKGNDYFVRHFDRDNMATIWAPVFTPDKMATLKDEIQEELKQFFTNGNEPPDQSTQTLIAAISNDMERYITQQLPSAQGEDGEGVNTVRLSDPFFINPENPSNPITLSSDIMINDTSGFKTSWSQVNDGNMRRDAPDGGRVGYSVKFVSLGSLVSGQTSANGQDSGEMSNPISASDSDMTADFQAIKH